MTASDEYPNGQGRTMNAQLLQALRDSTPEKISEALLSLPEGVAYDVGVSLLEANVAKTFPGPDPWNVNPATPDRGSVYVTDFDRDRVLEAANGMRSIMGWERPEYDPESPEMLRATRVERRKAERDHLRWKDKVQDILSRVSHSRGVVHHHITSEWHGGVLKNRAEAEALVARLEACGWTAGVEGFEAPATSHVRTLSNSNQPQG